MITLLMAIRDYSINGYWCLFINDYLLRFVGIREYFINDYL
jgi:hypothetical protein